MSRSERQGLAIERRPCGSKQCPETWGEAEGQERVWEAWFGISEPFKSKHVPLWLSHSYGGSTGCCALFPCSAGHVYLGLTKR